MKITIKIEHYKKSMKIIHDGHTVMAELENMDDNDILPAAKYAKAAIVDFEKEFKKIKGDVK